MNSAYDNWVPDSNPNIDYETQFSNIIKLLNDGRNFTFLRISDGEYHLMKFNKSSDNGIDATTIKDILDLLYKIIGYKKVINPSNLLISSQWGTIHDNRFLDIAENLSFLRDYASAIFSWITVHKSLAFKFFDSINKRNPIILVGPHYLRTIPVLSIDSFIECDPIRSWKFQKELDVTLDLEISKYNNPTVLYCCGASSKLMIIRNYFKYSDNITQIDLGANLNPYVEAHNRNWHPFVYKEYIEGN